jgi:DNA topoisomerase I
MLLLEENGRIAEPASAARAVGLSYVSSHEAGIGRRLRGKSFVYLINNRVVRDRSTLARIRKLAIPPAWKDVWICARSNGHLQATGLDARGRKQYLYNDEFRAVRETAKFEHILVFAKVLPAIRKAVAHDMALAGLPREKVIATIVRLLETTLVRVGNKDYAKDNGSYGLTTLRNPHVAVRGDALRFKFKGKSGKSWNLQVQDRRVARIVRACQDLPGQQLFEYRDVDGTVHAVGSSDINAYLHEATGFDITAKDFRTWFGTVAAATALFEYGFGESETSTRRIQRGVIAEVASKLGNTVTICRKCYIHPAVLEAHASGTLRLRRSNNRAHHALSNDELAVFRYLRQTMAKNRRH